MNNKNENTFVSEIEARLNTNTLKDIKKLREKNHNNYFKIDIDFLKGVDHRYEKKSSFIIDKYNGINSFELLNQSFDEAINSQKLISSINNDVNLLKDEIRKDLMTVIDYVDNLEDKINLFNINKKSSLGILILNKYNSYKLYSSNLDLNNINLAMKYQTQRLIYLKEINMLLDNYKKTNTKFNKDNTKIFINNLYDIISVYIYLLTDNEFQFTKEAIKKVLSYDFDFIDKYLYTYKIILTKIWNNYANYYFVTDLDLNKDNIYLLTLNNVDYYSDSGYICDVPKDFITYFNMSNDDIINFKLPNKLKEKYEIPLKGYNTNNISYKALYTKLSKINFDSLLPVVYIKK